MVALVRSTAGVEQENPVGTPSASMSVSSPSFIPSPETVALPVPYRIPGPKVIEYLENVSGGSATPVPLDHVTSAVPVQVVGPDMKLEHETLLDVKVAVKVPPLGQSVVPRPLH